jgi:hypothetical protein
VRPSRASRREPLSLDPDTAFSEDLEVVDPFYLGGIHKAVELLRYQAEDATRNRKRLRAPIPWCADATSVIRVGPFRVLFRVSGKTVHLLRLGVKIRERLVPARIGQGERP